MPVTSNGKEGQSRWKWARRLAVAISVVVAISAATGAIYLLAWYVPDVLARRPGTNASVESAYISAGAALLGVIATAAVAIFAFWYSRLTIRDQGEQLDKTLASQLTRTLNERFATAAGQLGGDKPPAVRLAGVYAMAGLADDWEKNRQTCVDVLCGYLRLPHEPDPGNNADPAERAAYRASREVRQTIIRLIGAHLRPEAPTPWQGLDFDFTGVIFDGGDFTAARFSGGIVLFTDAVFSGGQVRFEGAKFSGAEVPFFGAKFSGGVVRFDRAEFSGGLVFFRAQFSGGQVSFYDAEFSGAKVNFGGARFSGAEVPFLRAKFSGASVNFGAAQFSGSKVGFHHAEFSGAEVNFGSAEFSSNEVSFYEAKFSSGQVRFEGAKFSGAEVNFIRAEISGGQLGFGGAMFSGGIVRLGAMFSGGTVDFGAVFSGGTVDFGGAKFSGTKVGFDHARFSGGTVDFGGANFSGGTVDFDAASFFGGTVNLGGAMFSGGEVDFSRSADWEHPPKFGRDGAPSPGVKLPAQPDASLPDGPPDVADSPQPTES